jgi:hypothetical protein
MPEKNNGNFRKYQSGTRRNRLLARFNVGVCPYYAGFCFAE